MFLTERQISPGESSQSGQQRPRKLSDCPDTGSANRFAELFLVLSHMKHTENTEMALVLHGF